jgi:glycosyltransferase involved in cell wall biosynthesis
VLPEAESPRPVLIVDLVKGYGGAEVRVLDMAKALHGRCPYAVVALAGSPLHRRLEAAGLAALPVPYRRGDPRLLFFLRRAIHWGGYRVVDAHNVQSQFWGHLAAAMAGQSVRRVSTVHSAYRLEHAGSLKGRAYEAVLRLNAWLGARFIAISAGNYDYLQTIGVPQARIALIHNSLQAPEASARSRDLPLFQSLGWEEGAYVVTVVARLEPVKGHTYLIEALGRVAGRQPRLRCLIVGEGRARAALEAQVREAGLEDRVHFAGFRDDIPELLGASDAFCLPSLSEGLPYALLEACAYRLPLLVTQVGGMAELLAHRHTAYLVPPADPAALAEGLTWLIEHSPEAAGMGQAAFDQLRQLFSPEDMVSRTLEVYQAVR